jgi:hypothetical protein
MIKISHRGNINGRINERENSPDYIIEALKLKYDCEIDVWYKDDSFYLGHDKPLYKVDKSFLIDKKLWCHAKNIEALNEMLNTATIHCFFHQSEP